MFTVIIREQYPTHANILQVFVGEKAPVLASTWALNEILCRYTWPSGSPITPYDLNGDGGWDKVTLQMQTQGLRHKQDLLVLQKMVRCVHLSQHVKAVEALHTLHPFLRVETSEHAQVHTQGLVLSGPGVMDLFGVKTRTFTQLDSRLLVGEVHLALLEHAQEHPEWFEQEDFQHWRSLIEQKAFQEAHWHFVHSSIPRTLDIEFTDEWQVLVSPADVARSESQASTPPLPPQGPNLFTVSQALLQGNGHHVNIAPAELVLQAKAAVELHEKYLQVLQTGEGEADRDFQKQTLDISLTLTRNHLLPALIHLDPNLECLFFHHTGDHFLEVLPTLEFMGGDNGGWCDLAAKHKSAHISLTDSAPDYPRLDDVGITLSFDGKELEYQTTVDGSVVSVDNTRSFQALMGE